MSSNRTMSFTFYGNCGGCTLPNGKSNPWMFICAVCYHDRHQAAIVRTMDGRIQRIQGGKLEFEMSGLGQDFAPVAVAGDGRVALAATGRGSVLAMGWPRELPLAGGATSIDVRDSVGNEGVKPTPRNPGVKSTPRQGAVSQVTPRSGGIGGEAGGQNAGVNGAGVQNGVSEDGHVATSQGGNSHGEMAVGTPGDSNERSAAISSSGAASSSGVKEYRLHSCRVACMTLLASKGLLFTAR